MYDSEERIQSNTDGKYTVRINSVPSDLALDDIQTLFTVEKSLLLKQHASNLLPKCLFVPKTSTSDDIKWLLEKLEDRLKTYDNFGTLNMFFYMETALSLINLNEIIKTTLKLSEEKYKNRYNLEGFVFGSDDFCADIGASRTKDAFELIYARQKLVAYCKAYKLKAIDMVYIDYKGKNLIGLVYMIIL